MITQRKPKDRNRLERYNRQILVPGWDQGKLDNANIAIVGCDWLAEYTALTAAALGIGNISIIDNKSTQDYFLNFIMDKSMADSKEIKTILSTINPFVNIRSLETTLVNEGSKYFLENYDVILELTNDPRSKAIALEYCQENNVPCITAGTINDYGKIMRFDNDIENIHHLMPDFEGKNQDPITSLPLAGIIVEETRKILMGEDSLENTIYYTTTRPERFKPLKIPEKETSNRYYTTAIIIGAGALGNGIAIGLYHLGLRDVYIIDPDKVEETNLNRQVLFYDSVGEDKATALERKIKSRLNAKGIVETFPLKKDELPKKRVIMFDCVDNFKTRVEINKYAVKYGIPLISGGTDYQAGQVAVYVPEKTSCIEHQLHLEEVAEKAEEGARHSCIYAPVPSVVTSNMIISGLMVGEARNIMSGKEPLKGMLKYGSNLDKRLGFTALKEICNCGKQYQMGQNE